MTNGWSYIKNSSRCCVYDWMMVNVITVCLLKTSKYRKWTVTFESIEYIENIQKLTLTNEKKTEVLKLYMTQVK